MEHNRNSCNRSPREVRTMATRGSGGDKKVPPSQAQSSLNGRENYMGMIVRMEVHTASQMGNIITATQELVQDSLAPMFQSELSCH